MSALYSLPFSSLENTLIGKSSPHPALPRALSVLHAREAKGLAHEGGKLLRAERYSEAADKLNRSLALMPDNGEALLFLGLAQEGLGRSSKAG